VGLSLTTQQGVGNEITGTPQNLEMEQFILSVTDSYGCGLEITYFLPIGKVYSFHFSTAYLFVVFVNSLSSSRLCNQSSCH
jgi:hypothetical protein